MALREEQIATAVNFLGSEKVVDVAASEKEAFLLDKGLTKAEVAEAVRRFASGDKGSSGASAPAPTAAPVPPAPVAASPPVGGSASPYGAYVPAGWQAMGGLPPGGVPPYGMPSAYAGAGSRFPPYAGNPPASAGGGGLPGWAWATGGLCAGVAITAGVSALCRRAWPDSGDAGAEPGAMTGCAGAAIASVGPGVATPEPLISNAATVAAGPSIAPSVGPLVPLGASTPDSSCGCNGMSGAGVDGGAIGTADDAAARSTEPASEYQAELLAALKQQSEDSREASSLFRRCIQQQQDQMKQVVGELEKLLLAHTQQQKAQKGQPLELSAASLQTLASLLQPPPAAPAAAAVVGETPAVERGEGAPAAAAASPPSAPAPVDIRESFGAINVALQRLVADCTSKTETGKALQTLTMLLQNLLSNPNSERYNKVNTSNARFRELLEPRGAPAELLRLAGFKHQDPNYTFAPEQGTACAQRVRDLIVDAQGKLDLLWAARGPGEVPNSAAGGIGGLAQDEPGKADMATALPHGQSTAELLEQAEDTVAAVAAAPAAAGPCVPAAAAAAPAVAAGVAGAATRPWLSSRTAPQGGGLRASIAPAAGGELAGAADSSDGTAMAHPAESMPPMAQVGSTFAAGAALVQATPPPYAASVPAAPVPAHPAEGSALSGEPQSGG